MILERGIRDFDTLSVLGPRCSEPLVSTICRSIQLNMSGRELAGMLEVYEAAYHSAHGPRRAKKA